MSTFSLSQLEFDDEGGSCKLEGELSFLNKFMACISLIMGRIDCG